MGNSSNEQAAHLPGLCAQHQATCSLPGLLLQMHHCVTKNLQSKKNKPQTNQQTKLTLTDIKKRCVQDLPNETVEVSRSRRHLDGDSMEEEKKKKKNQYPPAISGVRAGDGMSGGEKEKAWLKVCSPDGILGCALEPFGDGVFWCAPVSSGFTFHTRSRAENHAAAIFAIINNNKRLLLLRTHSRSLNAKDKRKKINI